MYLYEPVQGTRSRRSRSWAKWLFGNEDDGRARGLASIAEPTTNVEEQLLAGKLALEAMRFRISGTVLLLGCLFGWSVQLVVMIFVPASTQSSGWGFACGMVWVATVGSMVIISFAPLEGDLRFTRITLAGLVVNVGIDAAWCVQDLKYQLRAVDFHDEFHDYLVFMTNDALETLFNICFMLAACNAMRLPDASPMQESLWFNVSVWLTMITVVDISSAVVCHFLECDASDWQVYVLFDVLALLICVRPSLRQKIQMRIRNFFETKQQAAASAGIASLIGDFSVAEAISAANQRFKGIHLNELTYEDMRASPLAESPARTMSLALPARARLLKLGSCDAFVSHSWHDDVDMKWHAIRKWQDAFVAEHGKEPCVWFDKASIDQNDVSADLRCLPVFLYGCKRLVIFCGPTYLSRLWCIMEIFTFVHMGGKNVELVPLLRETHAQEDRAALTKAIRYFDAEKCKCFDPKDKAKMLAIIQAAFGAIENFNEAVRQVMNKLGFASLSSNFSSSDVESSSSSS